MKTCEPLLDLHRSQAHLTYHRVNQLSEERSHSDPDRTPFLPRQLITSWVLHATDFPSLRAPRDILASILISGFSIQSMIIIAIRGRVQYNRATVISTRFPNATHVAIRDYLTREVPGCFWPFHMVCPALAISGVMEPRLAFIVVAKTPFDAQRREGKEKCS